MNKPEFISCISEKAGMTKKDAEKFLKAHDEVIIETLQKGEAVKLV